MGRTFFKTASQFQVKAVFGFTLNNFEVFCFYHAKIMQNQKVVMNLHEYYTLSDTYIFNKERATMQIRREIFKIVE
jgi:hypothetical protein